LSRIHRRGLLLRPLSSPCRFLPRCNATRLPRPQFALRTHESGGGPKHGFGCGGTARKPTPILRFNPWGIAFRNSDRAIHGSPAGTSTSTLYDAWRGGGAVPLISDDPQSTAPLAARRRAWSAGERPISPSRARRSYLRCPARVAPSPPGRVETMEPLLPTSQT